MNKSYSNYKGFNIFEANSKEEMTNLFLNPYGYNLESTRRNEVNYDYECLKTKNYNGTNDIKKTTK